MKKMKYSKWVGIMEFGKQVEKKTYAAIERLVLTTTECPTHSICKNGF